MGLTALLWKNRKVCRTEMGTWFHINYGSATGTVATITRHLSTVKTNITITTDRSHLLWHPEVAPLSHFPLQMDHDGWNMACFMILPLYILTVLSLAALALRAAGLWLLHQRKNTSTTAKQRDWEAAAGSCPVHHLQGVAISH